MFLINILGAKQFLALEFFLILLALFNIVRLRESYARDIANIVSIAFLTILLFYNAGSYSGFMISKNSLVRVSLSGSFWLSFLFAYLILIESAKNFKYAHKYIAIGFIFAIPVFFLLSGDMNYISVMREFYARKVQFYSELYIHILLSFAAVFAAFLFSFPLGVLAYKKRRFYSKIFGVLNVVQTIPSIAAFGALIVPLSYISKHIKFFSNLGVGGIGWAPAIIALIFYAMLPIVRNVYEGFNGVPAYIKEASRGMGMSKSDIFLKVELPISFKFILIGVKIALVQTIGNTALAALIGAGGMGVFIFQGLGEALNALIMLGVLPTVFLSMFADLFMQIVTGIYSKRFAV